MITKHLGLWKSEETQWYSSEVIKKTELATMSKMLKGSIRVVMRKNKYYQKDTNRPQFIFAFADAESTANKTIEYEKDFWEEVISQLKRIEELAYYNVCDSPGENEDRIGELRNVLRQLLSVFKE